jgi:hypothetical protein
MLFVIEIPHQMPAKCWYVFDDAKLISTVNAVIIQKHDGREFVETREEAEEYLADDLSRLIVADEDEALELFRDGIGGHQGAKAWDKLRQAMIDAGVIDSYGMTPSGREIAEKMAEEAGIEDVDEALDGMSREVWQSFNEAANGDVGEIGYCRQKFGLPILV